MLQVFDPTCKSMDVSFPRPIPGYGIRWNIKLQCWERLYNACEVLLYFPKVVMICPLGKILIHTYILINLGNQHYA